MKLVKLRWRLSGLGFSLEQLGQRWCVDNGMSVKNRTYREFLSLDEVRAWLAEEKRKKHD